MIDAKSPKPLDEQNKTDVLYKLYTGEMYLHSQMPCANDADVRLKEIVYEVADELQCPRFVKRVKGQGSRLLR